MRPAIAATMLALTFVAIGVAGVAREPRASGASYTTDQAYRGRLAYYESCAECHGGKLEGVFGPALAGGDDNLQYQAVKDVYAYMAAHMPHGNPESLPQTQYLAIMAFIMQSHGLPSGSAPLTIGTVAADKALLGGDR